MTEREGAIAYAAETGAADFSGLGNTGEALLVGYESSCCRFVLFANVDRGGEALYRWHRAENAPRLKEWRALDCQQRAYFDAFVAIVNALAALVPEEKAAPTPPPVVDRQPPHREDTIFARDQRAFDSAYPEAVRRGETTTAGISVRQVEPVLAPQRHEASAPAFSVSYGMGAAGVVTETPKGERFDPAAFLAQARADYAEAFEAQGLDPATAALRAEAMTTGPAGQRLAAEAAPPPVSKEPSYDQAEIVETDASAFLAPDEKGPAKGRYMTRRKA